MTGQVKFSDLAGAGSLSGTDVVPIRQTLTVQTTLADILAWIKASFALTNTHILVGNGSGIATDVAMSGDATIANTGAVTVANSAVLGKC